jgi:hypothetical protein
VTGKLDEECSPAFNTRQQLGPGSVARSPEHNTRPEAVITISSLQTVRAKAVGGGGLIYIYKAVGGAGTVTQRRENTACPQRRPFNQSPHTGGGRDTGRGQRRHGGSPRPFGAYIGVVGEDRPSPQRGAFAQLAACIRQDKTRGKDASTCRLGSP